MNKKKISKHYEHRIHPHREHYDILDWASAESQLTRFQTLVGNVDLTGKSLLDVGCGLGDLYAFLRDHGVDVDYTGVDILAKMVAAAQERHPAGRFIQGDVFVETRFVKNSYDVVFCSGVFNLNLGNNLEFLPAAAERLAELSRETAVFNMLHKRAQGIEQDYFYYDPNWVLKKLASLNCRVRIIDDYLPNDFTVICKKL